LRRTGLTLTAPDEISDSGLGICLRRGHLPRGNRAQLFQAGDLTLLPLEARLLGTGTLLCSAPVLVPVCMYRDVRGVASLLRRLLHHLPLLVEYALAQRLDVITHDAHLVDLGHTVLLRPYLEKCPTTLGTIPLR
jgi:hypothetical protein